MVKVVHTYELQRLVSSLSKAAEKVTLEQLEQLAAEGKLDDLYAALSLCRFNDLRSYLNALGIKVRTKQYEDIRSKEDHVKLLAQVLL
ncbi:hypothetical protein GN244_ATG19355 [Phytophthora infestans]|uniref:Uncharacterized protein n=1 Tax=Phytophthora infestans TaxID=4787 RepID=A0A833S7C6_PHYIN|nr:hypothetical protein GN244_ATG19355 [Phytophthora infestans]KAF4135519.1 hypothetical protein GN958_ATG15291 [Phytophthora infestans]